MTFKELFEEQMEQLWDIFNEISEENGEEYEVDESSMSEELYDRLCPSLIINFKVSENEDEFSKEFVKKLVENELCKADDEEKAIKADTDYILHVKAGDKNTVMKTWDFFTDIEDFSHSYENYEDFYIQVRFEDNPDLPEILADLFDKMYDAKIIDVTKEDTLTIEVD